MRSRSVPVSLWTRLSWPNHALIPRTTLALATFSLSLTCIALSASLLASSFIRSSPPPASPSSTPHHDAASSGNTLRGPVPRARHRTVADSGMSGDKPGTTEILGGMDGSGVEILPGDATTLAGGEEENNPPEKSKKIVLGKVEKSGFRWYEWVLGAFASPLGAFSELSVPYHAEQRVLPSGQGSSGSRREGRVVVSATNGLEAVIRGDDDSDDGGGERDGRGEVVAGSQEKEKMADEEERREEKETGQGEEEQGETQLRHVMFNIASSRATFPYRRAYLRSWWRPGGQEEEIRGYVWVDDVAAVPHDEAVDPPVRASTNTSHLSYRGTGLREYLRLARIVVDAYRLGEKDVRCEPPELQGHGAEGLFAAGENHVSHLTYRGTGLREYLRLSRIVVDAYRLGEKGVRWYVMGDDDTFFSPRAITAFLGQYDHKTPLYLGAPSETHYQNVANTHGMAFGGGGFAISAALARMLSDGGAMDACLERHTTVWGSDERVASCVGELGVSARWALAHMLSEGGAMDACLERHAAVWGSDERVSSCVGELGAFLSP
ncbi:unnamed protein product [Closterium sp. NIES-64]|nr:unnamed protein product [Closterium sp. NIES-64]